MERGYFCFVWNRATFGVFTKGGTFFYLVIDYMLKALIFLVLLSQSLIELCKAEDISDDEKIKVGVIIPLSGDLARVGLELKQGLEMSVQDLEDIKVELIFEDGALDRGKALAAYRKLTSIDQVKFIIGPLGPDQTLVMAPQAMRQGVLVVAISFCDDRYLDFPNLFCLFPGNKEQATPLYALLDNYEINDVVFLGEELQGFEPYRHDFFEAVTERGKNIVLLDTFLPGTTDFRAIFSRLKAHKNIDLIAVGGGSLTSVTAAFRQARELAIEPAMRWYISEHDAAFFRMNAELLEGAYSTAIPQINKNFRDRFFKKTKSEPGLYSALAYDALTVLAGAVHGAGDSAYETIAGAMIAADTSDSAIKGFKFDDKRRIDAPVYLTRIEGGQIIFVE